MIHQNVINACPGLVFRAANRVGSEPCLNAYRSAGEFRFATVKPGPVPGRGNAQQAPHFAIALHALGLPKALMTRAYFEDDPLNETDPLLSSIEDPRRRATLLARPESGDRWRLDIRLQRGAHSETETVFLDI
jgi:protocatechuate 3,4-dioxygenase alpha subunit